ncbi:hypothetical protein NDU88_004179 [Pleurodeles waltl]|uniref:Uncharacterized protein n=1 Tax=Pleurodeles waltl TaxID=8319 RepID=A0AAV7TQQ4_PLEWA|nr:hypothetical protein NDU88_004179 [Pleurodeles waltl]
MEPFRILNFAGAETSESGEYCFLEDLGFLQRDNPAIVTAAKTSQAIRTVLNNIKDTLQGLRKGGIVDQLLGDKLDEAHLGDRRGLDFWGHYLAGRTEVSTEAPFY